MADSLFTAHSEWVCAKMPVSINHHVGGTKAKIEEIVKVITQDFPQFEDDLGGDYSQMDLHAFKTVAEHFRTTCFDWHEKEFQIALSYMHVFARLCARGFKAERIIEAITEKTSKNDCFNAAWHGGNQPVALLRCYGGPGCFDSGLKLIQSVREPATATATVDCDMEQENAMESPAHCTTAGGDLEHNSGDLIDFFTEISTCYDIPACLEFPPTFPLLPMSMSPLCSPSAHHLCSGLAAGLPASISVMAPASESRTPPWPSDPAAPPRLSAPSSSSSPAGPPASPGSLVFPAPPWSVVVPPSPQDSAPPAAPRHSVPLAPKDSSLPLAQPPSSVAPAPPWSSGSPPPPWSPEPRAPPWPFGSSVSPRIFGSPSPPRVPPPAAPPLLVSPLKSSALPPPWLLPPSAPLWVIIMAAFWVLLGSFCSGSLLFPPWLLPPSSPPWTVLCFLELSFQPWSPEPPTYPPLSMLYAIRYAIRRGA
ncbi:Titin [Labeo rohita]|uniref:Titin n=1 Tax=Labeo rohita TaxID=84645 RepID=A0ABQ8L5P0_LABRO|nr:Titin [Labeo rohita]